LNTENLTEKKFSIKIEQDLYEELRKIVENSGFSSVDDYVNYILRSNIGKKTDEFRVGQEDLSQEDTEAVTARLKALGYI